MKIRTRIAALLTAVTAAVGGLAGPASADHFYYTREPQIDYHDNIGHWDLAAYMARTGTSYNSGITIGVVVGGCDQANQNGDANCQATWNGAADHAISAFNDRFAARPGPTPYLYRASYNTALYDPCTAYNPVFAGRVILCYDLAADAPPGDFSPRFQLSHDAYHLYGGTVHLNPNCWVTTIRFQNCATHEIGHSLGLHHRGAYGFSDEWSGQYQTTDPNPGSIMDIAPTNYYTWPDTHDIDLAVLLNGGYLPIAGINYCLEDHTGQCPGVNLRFAY